MPQVEQTRSTTSSMTLSMMRTQNAATGHTHPYAHQQLSAPRKHRLSPPRTHKSNDPGPGPVRRALSARSQGSVSAVLRDSTSHHGFRQQVNGNQSQLAYSNQRPQVQNTPTFPGHSPLHVVDQAFTVCTDRLHSSLNEFRAVCTTLVVHEQEERRRVHNLCLKIMQERDLARQKVDALMTQTDRESIQGLQRKRSREEVVPAPKQVDRVPSSDSSSAPKVTGFLETSLSPVLSPDVGPFDLPLSPPSTRPASDRSPSTTAVNTTLTAPSHISSPFCHTSTSLSPLNLPLGLTRPDPDEVMPQVKRRKSCDESSPSPRPTSSSGPYGTDSRPASLRKVRKGRTAGSSTTTSAVVPAPINFQHVDLMYVPNKSREGGLVCRACLLDTSKSRLLSPSPLCLEPTSSLPSPTSPPTPSSRSKSLVPPEPANVNIRGTFEPTSFPPGASWQELRDHCIQAHPKECEDVNRLHPSQVWELRRRLGIR